MTRTHHRRLTALAVLGLATLATAGCAPSEGDPDVLDATSPASVGDGALGDASVLDAQVADDPREQPRACYSPVSIPAIASALAKQDLVKGCACIPDESTSYCLDGTAILCGRASRTWQVVLDGPCFPPLGPAPVGSCEKLGGTQVARGATCPSGFATRRGYSRKEVDAGAGDYEDCCYPIEVPAKNCTGAGLKVVVSGTQSSSLDTSCGDAGVLRSFVVGEPSPSLCCSGTP